MDSRAIDRSGARYGSLSTQIAPGYGYSIWRAAASRIMAGRLTNRPDPKVAAMSLPSYRAWRTGASAKLGSQRPAGEKWNRSCWAIAARPETQKTRQKPHGSRPQPQEPKGEIDEI